MRESGRSTTCKNNLRQLGLGLQRYKDAVGCYFPNRVEDPNITNRYGVNNPRWQWLVANQLGRPAQNLDALLAAGTSDPSYTNVPLDNEIFFDPSLTDAQYAQSIRSGAYGYNFQYLGNNRHMVDGNPTTPTLNYPVRRVTDESRTIAFGDSRGGNIPHGGHSLLLDPPHMRPRSDHKTVNSPSPMLLPGFDPYGPDETGTDIVIYFSPAEERHNGFANVVFLDDHVESLTLDQLGYVMQGAVPQPQTSTTLPWGDNSKFNGVGLDETSPNFLNMQTWQ